MRMVVSLADLDTSRWVNLTGASGHAFDDHYVDQTDLWVDGRTLAVAVHPQGGRGGGRGHADPQARERRVRPAGVTAAVTGRSCAAAGTSSTSSPS